MSRPRLPRWVLLLLFLWVAATSAYDYSFLVSDATRGTRIQLHKQILEGSAEAPYAYRILVPIALDPVIKLAARVVPYDQAFGRVYAAYYLLALTFTFFFLFEYLSAWFSDVHALAGTLLVAATVDIALRHHEYQPWSLLEPALMSLGLLLILQSRHVALAILIALASLNRETGIFVVLLYAATRVRDRASVSRAATYTVIWGVIFIGERLAFDARPAGMSFTQRWVANTQLETLALTMTDLALFLGPLWAFAVLGYPHAPIFVRRSALVLVPYAVTVLLFGLWWEVRLLMPMYPVLVPLGLSYVFPQRQIHAT